MTTAAIYADILKIDKKNHIVGGMATSTNVDRDGQRMDADWLREAFPKWCDTFGNVRYMHQAIPVGKVISRSDFENDGFYITAKIVDPDTWDKIEQGILSGFSIGVKGATISPDPTGGAVHGKITGGEIIEVSVVDIPSCRESQFDVIKSATFDETNLQWLEGDTMDDITKGLSADIDSESLDVYKRYYSDKERAHMDESDFAGPHRSFPIESQADVDNAARLIGHAADPEAVKRRIIEIAHRKGFSIPDAWKDDTNKDVTLDSGLQGKNLEGQDDKKEDKSTVSDAKCKECGTALEDEKCPKCASADMKKDADVNGSNGVVADESKSTSVLDLVLSELRDIKAQIASTASQTDGDKDGDIDTTSDLEDKSDAEKEGDIEDDVTGKTVELDPSIAELVKSLVANEVARVLAEQADVSKSLVADETKSLVADVTKRVDEAFQSLTSIGERLEVVEQSAAPAKGAVMERDGVTKSAVASAAELLAIVSQQAKNAPDDVQTQAFAHLYKTTIPTGGQN